MQKRILRRINMAIIAGLVVGTALLAGLLSVVNTGKRAFLDAQSIDQPQFVAQNLGQGSQYEQVNETEGVELYTADGKKIYQLKEANMLVDEDGRYIINPVTGAAVITDDVNSTLVDGANHALDILHNSVLSRAEIQDHGTTLIGWDTKSALYTVFYKPEEKLIYATRKASKYPWWDIFKEHPNEYIYTDYHGKPIKEKDLLSKKELNYMFQKSGSYYVKGAEVLVSGKVSGLGLLLSVPVAVCMFSLGALCGMLGLTESDAWTVTNVKIYGTTTVARLHADIAMATIVTGKTLWWNNYPVTTSNGYLAYVKDNGQLYDVYEYPLIDLNSGLPVVYYHDEIMTTENFIVQTNGYAVMTDVISIKEIIGDDEKYFMPYIIKHYGEFAVPTIIRDGKPYYLNGMPAEHILAFKVWQRKPTWNEALFGGIANVFRPVGKFFANIGQGIGNFGSNVASLVSNGIYLIIIVVIGGICVMVGGVAYASLRKNTVPKGKKRK